MKTSIKRSRLCIFFTILLMTVCMTNLALADSTITVTPESITQVLDRGQNQSQLFSIGNSASATTDLNYKLKFQNVEGAAYYEWQDSKTAGGPTYVWNDISLSGVNVTELVRDEAYAEVPFGFDFPFYEQKFPQVVIHYHGYLTFGNYNYSWTNTNLPNTSAPANIIAPFWDRSSLYTSGDVYYKQEQDRLIIQFQDVPYGSIYNNQTFQIVLEQGGTITIYYKSVSGNLDATLGLQNSTKTEGITVAYNNMAYFTNGLAVQFTRKPVWLSISHLEGTVVPGNSVNISALFNSNNITATTYHADILVEHNATNTTNPLIIPCTLSINNAAPVATYSVSPTTIRSGDEVTFNASATTDSDGTISKYLWDLDGDGARDDAAGPVIKHIFKTPGTYSVTLEAVDNDYLSTLETKTITVVNRNPVAKIVFTPGKPEPNQLVTFDASGSSDFDGNIQSYAWDLDNDSYYDDGFDVTASYTFNQVGTNFVSVKVTDNLSGTNYTTVQVDVRDNWPKISVNPTEFVTDGTVSAVLENQLVIENTGLTDLQFSLNTLYSDFVIKGGSSEIGYYWTDSDASIPFEYTWEDISVTGTKFTHITSDGVGSSLTLDFDFPYYQDHYRTLWIYYNGRIVVDDSDYGVGEIVSFPTYDAESNLIAPLYKDLSIKNGGQVHYLKEKDRVIIQWTNLTDKVFNGGYYTYQVIIHRDGTIVYNYHTLDGDYSTAVVGMQGRDRFREGLTITYGKGYLKSGLAVKIAPKWKFVQYGITTGSISAGQSLAIPFSVNPTGLESRLYDMNIEITHNASNQPNPMLVNYKMLLNNLAPNAVVKHNRAYIGYPVTFDASQSADADGKIASFAWSVGVDDLFDDGSEPTFTQTFTEPTIVKLKITDDDGESTIEELNITPVNPPIVTVTPAEITQEINRGNIATANLEIANTGNSDLNYQLRLVNPNGNNQYVTTDSDKHGGPQFVWNDISTTGVVSTVFSKPYYYPNDVYELSFDFPFYGNNYRRIYINDNGYITVGTGNGSTRSDFFGAIPDINNPEYMIAPFFCSLTPIADSKIYYLDDGETFTVQYDKMAYSRDKTNVYTFQVVLHADGSIYFYYKEMTGKVNVAVVGIQTEYGGLGLSYKDYYVKNGLAVYLTNKPAWVKPSPVTGTVAQGTTAPIQIDMETLGLAAGSYLGNLEIVHDDPNAANPLVVPVTMNVTNALPKVQVTHSPAAPYTGETVTFDASLSNDSDGDIVKWEWDLDNDTQFDDAVGAVISASFSKKGLNIVNVRVTDNDGGVSIQQIDLNLLNSPPTPVITSNPRVPDPGQQITFSAAESSDLDGTIVSYAWDLDGDTQYDDGVDLTAVYTFATVGTYSVGLEVTDESGAVSNKVITVEVQNWPKLEVSPQSFNETTIVTENLERILQLSNTTGQDLEFTMKTYYEGYTFLGGPNKYNYCWTDSVTSNQVSYVWEDIKTTGSRLYYVSDYGFVYSSVDLTFTFPFYGKEYTKIYVDSNGLISLDKGVNHNGDNEALPTKIYPAMIAGFFEDMDSDYSGDVYYQNYADKVVIQYDNVSNKALTGRYTFQIVLHKDGTIVFYYKEMVGECTSATIGIQNGSLDDTLTIAYNQEYVKDGLAVKIVNQPHWIQADPAHGIIPAGSTLPVNLTFNSSILKSQGYNAVVELWHNANNQPNPFTVPITLMVNNIAPVIKITNNSPYKGYTTTFDASGSADLDGKIVSYEWCLDNDNNFDDGTTSSVSRIYSEVGSYNVSLRLTDEEGAQSTETITVTVIEPPLVQVTPTSLSATVGRAGSVFKELTITNTGLSDLTYELSKANSSANYYWNSSAQANGPQYVWNDISTIGTRLAVVSTSDDAAEEVALSFDFPFYDKVFNKMYVATNGYITFAAPLTASVVEKVPTPYFSYAIAGLMYDDFEPVNGGDIYYYDDGEKVIVQYEQVAINTPGYTITFQMVMEANGDIFFYYKDISFGMGFISIGVQKSYSIGTSIAYYQYFVKSGLAVKVSNKPNWLQANLTGIVPAGESATVNVEFTPEGFQMGTYTANLQLSHNAPNIASPIIVPCTIEVINSLPEAVITQTTTNPYTGDIITLNGSSSRDLDGSIQYYAWDLDNDGQYDDGSAVNAYPSFANNGTYTVGLKVTDNNGGYATTSHTVNVLNRAPVAVITSNPTEVEPDEEITFSGQNSTDADGSVVSYAWDLDNDGLFNDGGSATVVTSFSEAKVHTIGLKVTDDDGDNTVTTYQVSVINRPKLGVSPAEIAETLTINQTSSHTFTLTNTGVVDVNFNIIDPVKNGFLGYDYHWYDSTSLYDPNYVWNDISLQGQLLGVSYQSATQDEVDISFDFPFYGAKYNKIYVSAHGYVTVGNSSTIQSVSIPLPTTNAPSGLIAGFMRALDPAYSGDIYMLDNGNQVIIQYNEVMDASRTGTYTFQIVLDVTGAITYYYKEMNGNHSNVTIGIQKDGNMGFTIAQDMYYVQNEMAVRIDTNPDWLEVVASQTNSIPVGGQLDVQININTAKVRAGDHLAKIAISHDANNIANPILIPVTLHVTNQIPTPVVTYTPTAPYVGLEVTLSGDQSTDTDGVIVKSEWDLDNDGQFDDGTGLSIQHTFTTIGTSTVNLRITDNLGGVSIGSVDVPVLGLPDISINPTFFDETVYRGGVSEKTMTISNPGDADLQFTIGVQLLGQGIECVSLNIDSGVVPVGGSTDIIVSFHPTYLTTSTIYQANLQIDHNIPTMSSVIIPVSVQLINQAPTPAITAPSGPLYKGVYNFDAISSTDDSLIVSYKWDFDNDGLYDDAEGVSTSWYYADNGVYSVGLEVQDNEGVKAATSVLVTILNMEPQPVITYSPENPGQFETITLSAADSYDPDGSISSYEWDLDNDGIFDSTLANVEYQFNSSGVNTVRLKVTDDDGASATTETTITVESSKASNFKAVIDIDGVNLSWTNPKVEIDSVTLVRKVGSFPMSLDDGEVIYEGLGSAYADRSLQTGNYYYALYVCNEGIYLEPVQVVAYFPQTYKKVVQKFQSGNSNPYSTTNTAENWRGIDYTSWNSEFTVGIYQGQKSDLWIQYPQVIGTANGQIPQNAYIEQAKLVLRVKDIVEYDFAREFKAYQITDPDQLGAPIFGARDGAKSGLNFKYRDNRLGRQIPWMNGADNILALFTGMESLEISEFTSDLEHTVEIDVTEAVQAWAKGAPNHGIYVTMDCKESLQMIFHGVEDTNKDYRPYLEVVYFSEPETIRPAAVTNFTAVPASNQILLSWNTADVGGSKVKIVRNEQHIPRDAYDGQLVYDGWSDYNGERLDTGLTNGTEYNYAIFAYDLERAYSEKAVITVIPGTPPTPVLVTAEPGTGYVYLDWDEDGDLYGTFATVFRKDLETGKVNEMKVYYSSEYYDYQVLNRAYEYWVVETNHNGSGQPSEVRTVTPYEGYAVDVETPIDLYIGYESNDSITLYWGGESTGVAEYVIERREPAGTWMELGRVNFDTQSYIDTGLTRNTTYDYRVKAVNIGSESVSYVVSGTTEDMVAPVTDLSWKIVSASQISVNWTDSTEEENYTVEIRSSSDYYISYLTKDSTSYVFMNLEPGVTYQITIYSKANGRNSGKVIIPRIQTSADPKNDLF